MKSQTPMIFPLQAATTYNLSQSITRFLGR